MTFIELQAIEDKDQRYAICELGAHIESWQRRAWSKEYCFEKALIALDAANWKMNVAKTFIHQRMV